jgi:drug/metabolite transporter (DMT)-like permease
MSNSSHSLRGWLALLGAIFLFSTIEIASKVLHKQAHVDSMTLVFVRFLVTGIVLLAISWPRLRRELTLGVRDYGLFALNGFIGITVAITLFHEAINLFRNASSAAVVFSVNPVFVTLLAPFINHEKWTVSKVLGSLLGACGVVFFAWESGTLDAQSVHGLALMLLSAALFGLSICISKRIMPKYGAMVVMGYSGLFGALFLLPLLAFRFEPQMGTELVKGWTMVLYIAVMGTAVAYGLYYYGIHHTTAQGGSMSFFLKPVVASILAVAILHETINSFMIIGTSLILVGLFIAEILPKLRATAVPALVEEPVGDG